MEWHCIRGCDFVLQNVAILSRKQFSKGYFHWTLLERGLFPNYNSPTIRKRIRLSWLTKCHVLLDVIK